MAIDNRWVLRAILCQLTLLVGLTGIAPASINMTFDTPVVTGATQAPGVWYTDRYAPAGFTSPVSFLGDNRLQHSISAADSAAGRPAAFSSSFYNTQGRKYDLDAATTSMQIDLYVDPSWLTDTSTLRRWAGFWGTAIDGTSAVSAFPIIEFITENGVGTFRGWDSDGLGSWVNIGLPTGFTSGWQALLIEITGADFLYTVGDKTATVPLLGSVAIDNTILQGHNSATGVSYDIYWDNLIAPGGVAAVPEATSLLVWSVLAMTVGGYASRRRQRVSN